MEKKLERLGDLLLPFANAIGNQKHMQAIRNGLISILPLTLVGSFFVIFLNLPFPGYNEFIAPYRDILDIPFRYTVGIMSLYASYTIAAHLSKSYKLDMITSGFLGMLAFILLLVPVNLKEGVTTAGLEVTGRYLPITPMSAQGLFGAILASLIAVEIYHFMKERKVEIKMPESVPPVVASSFSALFPTLVIILLFWVVRHLLNIDVNGIITFLLYPLQDFLVGNNLFGGILTVLLICGFWILGIHGPAVLGPIIRPFWDQAIAQNTDAFQSGVSEYMLPNIFTEQFLQWFLWIGGAGTTLALVVMFCFSKSVFLKQLGKLSFLPGIFNINEPMIFGAPIVMNPILAIPFILTPVVNIIIAYTLTIMNILPRMVAKPPFTMPAPLGAMMSTNWNIMSFIMVFVFFFISYIIYWPFFKIFEKRMIDQEKDDHPITEQTSQK
ncbi:PTS system cellobiose-specific IIC component [Erysipelotrichaceae bacterium]|nr:PTS system cellobiose-specific IIC component [Erysipelotrichaceae bacterium]